MQEQHGDQLQIIGIDTSHPAGSTLYGGAIERFEIPQDRLGVPTLIVGDTVLVGGAEIPALFPALVENGLSAGGIGWPDIPDLAVIIPDLPASADPGLESDIPIPPPAESNTVAERPASVPTAVPTKQDVSPALIGETSGAPGGMPTTAPSAQSLEIVNSVAVPSESQTPPADPLGFNLARLVLIGMAIALIYSAWLTIRSFPIADLSTARCLSWVIPALALIGLGVSLYLSYVEVARVEAVCGPIGECNIVQSSPYAQLLGIPVAVLGALSYIAIIAMWAGQRFLLDRLSVSYLGLMILTFFGTVFSIYLTMLELFTIRAICAWCLSSAVIMTLLMVLVVTTATKQPAPMKLEVHA